MHKFLGGLLLATLLPTFSPAWAAPEDISVTNVSVVSSQRAGRTFVDYVLQVSVNNAGPALVDVAGTAVSVNGATAVLEGSLVIGDLDPGASVLSDTITIRHNRRYRFSPRNLDFSFTGSEVVTNQPPVADAGPNQNVFAETVVQLDGAGSSDPDTDPLSFTWTLAAPTTSSASLSEPNDVVSSFTADVPGEYVATLTVNDGQLADTDTVTITVQALGDNPPQITSAPVTVGAVGEAYAYLVIATDDDAGEALTYSLTQAPAGMVIDPVSGQINWLPEALGSFDVDLLVTDRTGLTDRQIYLLTVGSEDNTPPLLAGIENQVVSLGDAVEATAVGSDDEGDPLRYGLVSGPAGAVINAQTGAFSWQPDVTQVGDATVTLSVSDPGGLSASTSFLVTVLSEDINNAPVIDPVDDQTVNALSTLALRLTATDADVDDLLTYSLSGVPAGLQFDERSGEIYWAPSPADAGRIELTATVSDSFGDSSSTSFAITVVEPPVAPVANNDAYTIGQREVLTVPAPGVLINDEDGNGDPLSATATSAPEIGTLDAFDADGSFQYSPPPIPPIEIGFSEQCETESVNIYQTRSVMTADVDADGDIEMVTLHGEGVFSMRVLIFDATTCALESSTLWRTAEGASYGEAWNTGGVTLVNLDDDAELEIVAIYSRGSNLIPDNPSTGQARLIAMNIDGTPVWGATGLSEVLGGDRTYRSNFYTDRSPSAVDLDGDGSTELIMAFYRSGIGSSVIAYNGTDGTILWEAIGRQLVNGPPTPRPWVIADLDLDGTVEIVFGASVFSHEGEVEFEFPSDITNLPIAGVGNFDDDPYGEIITVNNGGHRLFEHTGELAWFVPRPAAPQGGLTIAELDGDPGPEYVVMAGGSFDFRWFAAFDTDGSEIWSHNDTEFELATFFEIQSTTPVAFDFDRDGIDELVLSLSATTDGNDSRSLHIFDGADGTVIASQSGTRSNFGGPTGRITIADVDRDGAAEILHNVNVGLNTNRIRVLEGLPGNPYPPARAIRNQWLYQPTQVNEDGSIPRQVAPHWLIPGLNKQNVAAVIPGENEAASDSFNYIANDGSSDSNEAAVSIAIATVNAPTIVSTPPVGASPGFEYRYAALATDADFGDVLTWSLPDAPASMSVDDFGIVTWTPEEGDLGSVEVTLVVSDADGNPDSQMFEISVVPPVVVPDILGLGEADASTAVETAGLAIGNVRQNYSLTVPVGQVISQSLVSGDAAGAGSFIDFVVSLGPPPIFVPSLASLTEASAGAELAAVGLALGTVATENSDTIPRGLVISQSEAPGTQLNQDDAVDIVVSSGTALRVSLNARFVGAGESVALAIEAFDTAGDAVLPIPANTVSVLPLAGASGSLPSLSGLNVDTSPDTRGAYLIDIDVPGFGTQQLELIVRETFAEDDYLRPVADFASLLDALPLTYEAIGDALRVGDVVTVQALAQQLIATRDAIDLERLADVNPFALETGFLPSVAEASAAGFGPGFTILESGRAAFTSVDAAFAEIDAYIELLDPARARNDDVRVVSLNNTLARTIDELLALDLPIGTQLALNGQSYTLLSQVVPQRVRSDLDLVIGLLQDNGLAQRQVDVYELIAMAGAGGDTPSLVTKPAFFSLAGMLSATSIRSRLMNRIYTPYVTRLAAAGFVLIAEDILRETMNPIPLSAIITGASQSFHIFSVPGSMIEGVGLTDDGRAYELTIVGPDLFQGVLDVLASANPRSLNDVEDLADEIGDAVQDGIGNGVGAGNVNAVLRGCIFDPNPDCAQLMLGAGFPVVHRSGSFPAPVLVVLRDRATGQYYSGLYPFFPMGS